MKPLKHNLPYEPRITSEDSHDAIMGPDGKIVYKAKVEPKPLTQIEVCELANASDPRKHRRF